MPLFAIVIVIILCLGLIWLIYSLVWGTPPSINLAVERLSLKMIMKDPETLTTLGVIDNTLLDFHSGKLTDASPSGMQKQHLLNREGLALIRRYQGRHLTGQKYITYLLMRWYFEQNLRGHRFRYHWAANPVFMGPYPVNHVFGVQIDLINFLSTYHKIKGRRSAKRYIQRLNLIPWKIAGLLESLKLRQDLGVIPPKFVIEKSLRQMDDFLTTPIENNPLYTSFIEKAKASGRFDPSAIEAWKNRVQDAIENEVYPPYRLLQNYLEDLLEVSTDEDGIWKLPEGDAYYAFLLRNHTTTNLSPEEIHQLGKSEVEHIQDAIRDVLGDLGLPTDNPGEQLKALMADSQFHFTGENRRELILRDYQDILDEINRKVPDVFSFGALDEIVVERLPELREPDSPIAYGEAPAVDGSRPGRMWINLRDPDNIYQWGMRTLAYHEGIPGHVYQLAQAQKIKGLPTFRKTHFFNAHVEGWALYAEQLGWELGLKDDLSNLGRLQALLWRAARLVVDTGIHAKGWTRQEAIDYMLETTGLPERDVVTEVERYIVMPGQACAYYIGYLKVQGLRQKAQA
ncbi:MAG: DUF885 domain-containing protein, partial [Chloroflexota bacterium]|nr:DUF885 domain-containing protein [Chloroflexota bacterium]